MCGVGWGVGGGWGGLKTDQIIVYYKLANAECQCMWRGTGLCPLCQWHWKWL